MDLFKLENWCSRAVRQIRYPPDRNAVYAELYQHLEDRCESFTAKGIPEEEAKEMAVAAMGNPEEIAPQLAKIHRPFWGYCYSITKWVLIVAMAITLFPLLFHLFGVQSYFSNPDDTLYDGQTHQHYGEKAFYAEPNETVKLDGYRITLKKVVRWEYDGDSIDPDHIFFRLQVTKPAPWADKLDIQPWIWAVDSLGNTYRCYAETDYQRPCVATFGNSHTPFLQTLDLGLDYCVSRDAEWVELHYDRSGRNFVLRIDLTGGDAS